MKFTKKLLVCGLSLALLSSTGLTSVSAHRVHIHHHYRVARMMKRSHHNMKLNSAKHGHYLTYKQLIHDMDYEYKYHTDQYRHLILSTIWHNAYKFNEKQNETIARKPMMMSANGFNISNNLKARLYNGLYARADNMKLFSKQDSSFDTAIRSNLIKDINKTRVSFGLRPVVPTDMLQATADYRNPYVQYGYDHEQNYINYPHNTSNPTDNWIHGVDTGTTASNYLISHGFDANHLNRTVIIGSNSGEWHFDGNHYNDGKPLKYENYTPKGIAGNMNDGIINHDNVDGNNNGHRKLELMPNLKYIGVGVTYNQNTHLGSYNEQFGN